MSLKLINFKLQEEKAAATQIMSLKFRLNFSKFTMK